MKLGYSLLICDCAVCHGFDFWFVCSLADHHQHFNPNYQYGNNANPYNQMFNGTTYFNQQPYGMFYYNAGNSGFVQAVPYDDSSLNEHIRKQM